MSLAKEEAEARRARYAQDQRSESEVGGIEAAVSEVLRDPSVNERPLFDRLVAKVGLGDQPAKRRAFFLKLVQFHRSSPAAVENLIAEVWADSLGARNRSRFFCYVLVRRLRESRLTFSHDGSGVGDVI